MTVGEALAGARARAGLSVDELSERTKIREVVIRGIERDDYEACGGDLYVRGYVRVLADAVGLDAQPLIREYDRSRGRAATTAQAGPAQARPTAANPVPAGPGSARGVPAGPLPAGPVPARRVPARPVPEPGSPAAPAPDPAEPFDPFERLGRLERLDPAGPGPEVIDLTRAAAPKGVDLSRAGSPETVVDMMQAGVPGDFSFARAPLRETATDLPALEHGRSRLPGPRFYPAPTQRTWGSWLRGHRLAVAAVALAVVVFAVAIAGGQILSGGGGSGTSATGSTAARQNSPGLPVSFAEAFGPNGPGDGDNPVSATYPVSSGSAEPWTTQQYSTAQFGDEKTGTGLLLDMGRPVTVTSVAVNLGAGSGSGAALQLQAGNTTGALATAAGATHARGDVSLRPKKPVHARYLLVWFTQLPRASDGRYQASVYHITVNGRP